MRMTEGLQALEKARDIAIAPARVESATRLLMCAPDHFGVDYIINPWMEGQIGKSVHRLAQAQWENLRRDLIQNAALSFITPAPGLPDLVFTANAGLVVGDKAVVTRFHAPERSGEEPLFRAFFEAHGFDIAPWPEDVTFEGAGDALQDRLNPILWCGYGFRSSARAPALLEQIFDCATIGLRLVDPRFYHLDTCFCPLSDGWLLYYPGAFDDKSRALIERYTCDARRIEVCEEDAIAFACNAVEVDRRVHMNAASHPLRGQLRAAGFTPIVTPLSEFVKAGGGAKCLTLELASPAA